MVHRRGSAAGDRADHAAGADHRVPPRAARHSLPFEITAGADGNLWFTDQGKRPAIGRITPQGRITEFRRGLGKSSVPFGITAGPKKRLWFTDHGCNRSGRCAVGSITR